MLFRTKMMASAAVFALSASFATADGHAEMNADTVVATVNGSDITLGQLIMQRAQLPAQYQQLPDDVVFNGLIDQLINQQLLADTLENEPKRVAIALENEVRSLRAGEVVNNLVNVSITDEAIQQAYDARFEGVEPETEYDASHILVTTEDEAIEIQTLISDGADFAETAQERSTGPSGPNGGNLGWFGTGMMVAPFEEAVMTLEVGDVSDPVETQFGWHVIILNGTRETALPTLESLREELSADIQEATVTARIEELTQAAEIAKPEEGDFDFSILQNLELLED